MEKIIHDIPTPIPNYIVQNVYKNINERCNSGFYSADYLSIYDNTVAVFKIKLKSSKY